MPVLRSQYLPGKSFFVASALLALSACSNTSAPRSAPGPRQEPPAASTLKVEDAKAVKGRASPAPPPGIAKPPVGHDPALERLLQAAATTSPRMTEQELLIAQNDAFRFRGWRQHLPYINAGYSFGEFKLLRGDNRGNDEKLSGTYNLGMRYPIFAWGAIDAEKAAVRLREQAAMHGATMAWRDLAAAIRRDYYQAVILKNGIELQRKQLALEDRRQNRTAAVAEAGQLADNDRLARSVAYREKEFQLQSQTTELQILLANLRATSGMASLTEADIADTVPVPDVNPDALAAQLAAYNLPFNNDTAEARMARLQADIVSEEITQARARILPVLNLGASISQNPVQTNTNRFEMQTTLFAGINGYWNLFDRDATQTTLNALRVRRRLIETQLRASRERQQVNLCSQIEQIRASQRMLTLRLEYLASAHRDLEGLRLQLRLGNVSPLDVENAELNVLTLEKNIFNDKVAITRAYHQFQSGIEQDPTASIYTAPQNE